jgi:hypothetical protein
MINGKSLCGNHAKGILFKMESNDNPTAAPKPTQQQTIATPPAYALLPSISGIEGAMASAWFVSMICLICIAMAIFLLTSFRFQIFDGGSSSASSQLVPLAIGMGLVEFGLCVFLVHSFQLLPKGTPLRAAPMIVASCMSSFQLVASTGGVAMIAFGPYILSMLICGWILQRITGATLSWQDEPVSQRALGTRDLIAIAPLLLFMGIVPVACASLVNRDQTDFHSGKTIVFVSLAYLAASMVPLLICYGYLLLCRKWTLYRRGLSVVFVILVVVATGLDLNFSSSSLWLPWIAISYLGSPMAFCTGVLIGVTIFRRHGFAIVWANRWVPNVSDVEVRFDQIDAG